MTSKRISKEIKELQKCILCEDINNHRILHLKVINDDIYTLNIHFLGPNDSPYEELINIIHIKLLPEYPIKPPILTFKTKIFHPNISQEGIICLDILKDKWTPVYSIRTIILSIISLLSDPNPDSPLNGNAAFLYTTNKKEYNNMVLKNDI
jgi:ubiquitin-protein ligase